MPHPSGKDDWPWLQAMADSLVKPRVGVDEVSEIGVLRLGPGKYKLSKPLILGRPDANTVPILPRAHASFEYIGEKTDSPLMTFVGNAVGGKGGETVNLLQNATLECNNKCRGMQLVGQQHYHDLDHVQIEQYSGLGLDIRGWSAHYKTVRLTRGTGCALRVVAGDSTVFDNLHIGGVWGCWHAADAEPHWPHTTPAFTRALWEYEMARGKEAARERYAEEYMEEWPEDMPENEQAVIHLNSTAPEFRSFMIEQCGVGDRRLIYSHKQRGKQLEFNGQLYFERNWVRDAYVHIEGHGSGGRGDTSGFKFSGFVRVNAGGNSADPAPPMCKAFMRLGGNNHPHISTVHIEDIISQNLSRNIITLTGPGHYYDVHVHRARTHMRIPKVHWVWQEPGAVYEDELPLGIDHVIDND